MSIIESGDRGASVRRLQQQLQARGFSPGIADGKFGQNTESAVRRFQEANGLKVDGRVGSETRRALRAAQGSDSFESGNVNRSTRPEARRAGERPYRSLQRFARERGFHVTSTTGGRHLGRAHREGRAVDVRTRDHTRAQVDQFMREARAAGYTVIDERGGGNSAWSGPHVHIQVP